MIQLGRKEYWIAATAVSPSFMYSSGSIIAGFSQPVPVVVATTSTLRLNAPVRSSSLTTSADSASIDGAELRPAYTRIGSIACVPVNRLISAAVGPPATKVLPCRPSVSHGTSESGPPDRIGDAGWMTPAAVPLSTPPNTELAALIAPCDSAPVASSRSSTHTTSTATAAPARSGTTRPTSRAISRTTARIPRATMIRAAVSSTVTTTTRM